MPAHRTAWSRRSRWSWWPERSRERQSLLRERDPETIRKAVASPGGTTEAGLDALAEAAASPRRSQAAVEASLARFR